MCMQWLRNPAYVNQTWSYWQYPWDLCSWWCVPMLAVASRPTSSPFCSFTVPSVPCRWTPHACPPRSPLPCKASVVHVCQLLWLLPLQTTKRKLFCGFSSAFSLSDSKWLLALKMPCGLLACFVSLPLLFQLLLVRLQRKKVKIHLWPLKKSQWRYRASCHLMHPPPRHTPNWSQQPPAFHLHVSDAASFGGGRKRRLVRRSRSSWQPCQATRCQGCRSRIKILVYNLKGNITWEVVSAGCAITRSCHTLPADSPSVPRQPGRLGFDILYCNLTPVVYLVRLDFLFPPLCL